MPQPHGLKRTESPEQSRGLPSGAALRAPGEGPGQPAATLCGPASFDQGRLRLGEFVHTKPPTALNNVFACKHTK